MSLPPAASVEGSLEIPEGRCVISYSLNVQDIINSVKDDGAGATAVFIGMEDSANDISDLLLIVLKELHATPSKVSQNPSELCSVYNKSTQERQ